MPRPAQEQQLPLLTVEHLPADSAEGLIYFGRYATPMLKGYPKTGLRGQVRVDVKWRPPVTPPLSPMGRTFTPESGTR